MPRHDGTPSRSGPSVPNAQRKTVARLLRLTPEEDAALVAVADGAPLARVVGRLATDEERRREKRARR